MEWFIILLVIACFLSGYFLGKFFGHIESEQKFLTDMQRMIRDIRYPSEDRKQEKEHLERLRRLDEIIKAYRETPHQIAARKGLAARRAR